MGTTLRRHRHNQRVAAAHQRSGPEASSTVRAFQGLTFGISDSFKLRAVERSRSQFLTPPIDRGVEIRCYMRDPDGHLIEVGQSKTTAD
jgi:hypothetical protein